MHLFILSRNQKLLENNFELARWPDVIFQMFCLDKDLNLLLLLFFFFVIKLQKTVRHPGM